VTLSMSFQVHQRLEDFLAYSASVGTLNFLVAFDVFIKVRFLGESKLAASFRFVRTRKWSLTSVNAQVIIEVVELPEELLAILMITLKDFQVPICSRVSILKDPKVT